MNKEGKHNLKLFFITIVILMSFMGLVRAIEIFQSIPVGGDWSTSTTNNINVTCIGDNHTYGANLSIDFGSNGSFDQVITNIIVPNFTDINISADGGYDFVIDGDHLLRATCWNDTIDGLNEITFGDVLIKIDSTAPVVNVIEPYNSTGTGANYVNVSAVTFGANCSDTNPNQISYDIDGVRNRTNDYENGVLNNYQVNLAEGVHVWNAICTDDAGNVGSNETNGTFIVDTLAPVWTLASPVDGSWNIDGSVDFTGSIVENNYQSCELWEGTIAGGSFLNQTNAVNATDFETLTYTDGDYIWNTNCTDLAGLSNWTANYTFSVDTGDPEDTVNLSSPYNGTTGTDLRPNFTWSNAIIDVNFLEYTLVVDTNSDFSSPDFIMHITDNSTLTVELNESLIADTTYYWKVNVTAESGRGSDSNETMQYNTDSTCGTTFSGYNFCGIARDENSGWDGSYTVTAGITADQIQKETDATYVYKFNASHNFVTYQNGTSTNKYMNFTTGDVAIFFMGSDNTWPVSGGAYAGRTWNAITESTDSWSVNFTNATDGYNLFSIRVQEGRTFANLTASFEDQGWNATNSPEGNASILYMSYINNSGSVETCTSGATDCGQFVPFRWNRTINENTNIDFTEAIWAYLNGTTKLGDSAYWNRSCDFTVDGSCGSEGEQ